MKKTVKIASLVLLSLTLTFCSGDDGDDMTNTDDSTQQGGGDNAGGGNDGGDNDNSLPTTIDEIKNLSVNLLFDGNTWDSNRKINAGTAKGTVKYVKDRKGNDGKAVEFNGISYIRYRHDDDLYSATNFTISIWAKPNENHPESIEYLFSKDGQYNFNIYTVFEDVPDVGTNIPFPTMKAELGFSSNPKFGFGSGFTSSVTKDKWQHYALVVSNTTMTVFIDGVEAYSRADLSGNLKTKIEDLNIGARVIFSPPSRIPIIFGGFDGAIDDFKFYKRTLTEQEIKLLANDK